DRARLQPRPLRRAQAPRAPARRPPPPHDRLRRGGNDLQAGGRLHRRERAPRGRAGGGILTEAPKPKPADQRLIVIVDSALRFTQGPAWKAGQPFPFLSPFANRQSAIPFAPVPER